MTKRIEEELAEMNRLKRLELEFLFFKTKMDATMYKKFRDALTLDGTMSEDTVLGDIDIDSESQNYDENTSLEKLSIKKVAA
ncbi:hypothetical protein AAA799E16_01506 [Marine Group I thaumarchaeote SCGC AAA799-E16]|uniref:Uncharacterized protein n=4 Tax=Marine Group I TaxID=905826 RepID=A0A081RMI4_9ARCH|nr:hypothetical protein AAA799N04_01111 [Marine Group I thaumarchaeote SCGC AAA799-N04]KER05780.1 hypothetical protein AAA799E16_01506 [Marine Group I thaumarchaeote SCGC AAA799-E16]KFM15420.1 hypothetical protein AAA799D11_01328 [Marine Group I thaumarchaeote SCGC AAA799-D11]KFM16531.1 hypothetical protein SCCGRSA3_02225 [Marine Group I thaumarchaeote SCGC RSA3]